MQLGLEPSMPSFSEHRRSAVHGTDPRSTALALFVANVLVLSVTSRIVQGLTHDELRAFGLVALGVSTVVMFLGWRLPALRPGRWTDWLAASLGMGLGVALGWSIALSWGLKRSRSFFDLGTWDDPRGWILGGGMGLFFGLLFARGASDPYPPVTRPTDTA